MHVLLFGLVLHFLEYLKSGPGILPSHARGFTYGGEQQITPNPLITNMRWQGSIQIQLPAKLLAYHMHHNSARADH